MKETSHSIEAVGFDLDNTLVDRDAALHRLLKAWAGHENEEVLQQLIALDASGYGDRTAFFQLLGESVRPRVSPESAKARFREEFPDFFEPALESIELLQTLGSLKIPFALLSNGSSKVQRGKLRATGLEPFFPDPRRILISEEIGCKKPDQRAFDLLAAALGTTSLLFVGDHPENDLTPARAAGFRTAWVKRGTSRVSACADFTVDASLLELIPWIKLQIS